MNSKRQGLAEVALACFHEALRSADPAEAVLRYLRVKEEVLIAGDVDYFLNQFKRIWVIGAGKASARMALGIEQLLADRIHDGLVIVKYGYQVKLNRIKQREAGHPVPDEEGLKATEELLNLISEMKENDLVLNCISGGGSSLLVAPVERIKFFDYKKTIEILLRSGMPIEGVNTVRKHLSRVGGGRLAKLIYPATCISLILSDVIGDRLDIIASGPTVPDPSSFSDAILWLERYNVKELIPKAVLEYLERGKNGEEEETPKANEEVFQRIQNLIVGSNRLSLLSAKEKARRLGFNPLILSSFIQGEVRSLAKFYSAIAKEVIASHHPVQPPAVIISGGEPVVVVKGCGKGGRAQELALAMAIEIEGLDGVLFLAGGTDGTDGFTEADGAISDWETISQARAIGMNPIEYLEANDSYNFFLNLGDLLITGPTGTNVMDIHLLVIG